MPPGERNDGDVSVVVVAHNSGATLADCVDRVLAQTALHELIVVDNGSVDGSIEALPTVPALRLLRQPDNPGFSVACNRGAELAGGRILLFLNPDCLLEPGMLARLAQHLDTDPALTVLGAQLLDVDGTPQAAARRLSPTPARILGGRWRKAAQADADTEPAIVEVEAVSGALMAMSRNGFERLGGFDEGYRLHCEDLDLCRRALLAGGKVAVATDVRPVHVKGVSSRRRPVWVEWHKHRGMCRYFRKFDATASPLWLRLIVPLGIAARFPLAAVRAWLAARRVG